MKIQQTPQLTIAIPTYQRKAWLQECLRRVLEQVAEQEPGKVEVVVCDNAGSDGSWDWLLSQAKATSALRVYRNERNLGAEGNIRGLPELSHGRYLWLLGDDDYLRPGALAKVLAVLERGCDYVALNFSPSDEHHQREGQPNWAIPADIKISSVRDCCAAVPHFAMGFLSSWVARRELFNTTPSDDYDHFKQWGLSVMVDRYRTIALGRHGIVMAESVLSTRKPPTEEYPPRFDYFGWFFEGSTAVFRYLLTTGLLDEATVSARRAWLLQTIAVKRILYERSAGMIDRERVLRILKQGYRDHWQYWLLCLPALYLPGLGHLTARLRRIDV